MIRPCLRLQRDIISSFFGIAYVLFPVRPNLQSCPFHPIVSLTKHWTVLHRNRLIPRQRLSAFGEQLPISEIQQFQQTPFAHAAIMSLKEESGGLSCLDAVKLKTNHCMRKIASLCPSFKLFEGNFVTRCGLDVLILGRLKTWEEGHVLQPLSRTQFLGI